MWEILSFEKCLDKVKTPPKLQKKEYLEQGKFPVVSQEASLVSGYCDESEILFKIVKPIIVFGDHTQILKYIDFDFVMGADGVKILQPIEKLNPRYFYYFLTLNMPKSTGYARHYRLLKELSIPLSPLAEQQRIVAKLDAAFAEIDTAIETAEAKKVEVEKLKASLLSALLSGDAVMWKTVKLGDICDLVGGGTPSKKNADYYDGNIPWATVRDMAFDELCITEHKITELGLKNSSSKVIPKSNVIIASRVGLGKVCILRQDTAINQDLRGVIPKHKNEIDKSFLFYWFQGIANQIIAAGRGATVQGVNLPFLNSLSFSLPPLAEQQRIVAKLDAVFSELAIANEAIEKSKTNYAALKSAILTQELQSEAA